MHPHVIANPAASLDVGQGTDLQINACDGFFSNRDSVAGDKPLAEAGSLIENAVGTNQRATSDDQGFTPGEFVRHPKLTIATDLAIIA
jgi:hypothetical protein